MGDPRIVGRSAQAGKRAVQREGERVPGSLEVGGHRLTVKIDAAGKNGRFVFGGAGQMVGLMQDDAQQAKAKLAALLAPGSSVRTHQRMPYSGDFP